MKAFFLHPEIPREGRARTLRSGEAESDRVLGEPLRSLADEAGLVMRRAKRTPYTRLAQAATEYARQSGHADAFHRATYRAFWEDGADLGDMAVLEGLADDTGLDWSDLAPRLETGEFDRTLQDQHDEAMQVGIWGVPGFVVDDAFFFTGAQPLEMFRLAAKRALDTRKHGVAQGFGGVVIGEG